MNAIVFPTTPTSGVIHLPDGLPYSIWTPASAPNVLPGMHAASQRAAGKLYQDTAKTIPAVNNGDPVQAFTCLHTGVDFTITTGTVTLGVDGNQVWLQGDAARFETPANYSASASDPISALVVFRNEDTMGYRKLQGGTGQAAVGRARDFEANGGHLRFFAGGTTQYDAYANLPSNVDRSWVCRVQGTAVKNLMNGDTDNGTLTGGTLDGYTNQRVGIGAGSIGWKGRLYAFQLWQAMLSDADARNAMLYGQAAFA